jgi:hypothetical protein
MQVIMFNVKVNSNPSELQYIAQPEGYVSHIGAGNFQYVYKYRDHLGNIRLSFTDSDMDGVATAADIIEENNFYPFGLKHKGYNNVYNSLLGGNAYDKYAFPGAGNA